MTNVINKSYNKAKQNTKSQKTLKLNKLRISSTEPNFILSIFLTKMRVCTISKAATKDLWILSVAFVTEIHLGI